MTIRYAPWDITEINSLNSYQEAGVFHEYTCNNSHRLVATEGGWICPKPDCGYSQDWAHDWTMNWRWDI